MLTIQQISVGQIHSKGTPGSATVSLSFDVQVITRPTIEAYRVAMRWTPDGWRTTYQTEAELESVSMDRDLWTINIAFSTEQLGSITL
jgi:hypothetical protein